jgi:hypothetical protein
MKDLHECYEEMAELLGADSEPYESVELVENYRQYWRPDNVRVILLAESHVFTTNSDRQFKLNPIDGLPGYPAQYAKFVYCLAYGEDSLTDGDSHPGVDGTPQFWKIFFSCVNEIESNALFASVLKSHTPTIQRVRNKIGLLKALRASGIWLVDASVMALYNKGRKPPSKVMYQAILTSWLGYTRDIIEEANPDHVIVVGKGVARVVEQQLAKLVGGNYSVIEQPNAHLSAERHLMNFQTYYRLCSRSGNGAN